MQVLNAVDAIPPAWTRTRQMLFAPFRKGRSWKLAATAYLARAGTVFVPLQLIYLVFLPAARRTSGAGLAALLVGAVLLLTALTLLLFYAGTRLQFVLFELVLVQGERVAPAWGRYARQSGPWMWSKVLVGTAVTAALAFPLTGYARRIMSLVGSIQPGQTPPPELLESFFAGYGVLLLVLGTFFMLSMVLTDLVLPPMALGGATVREALRETGRALRTEPGPFAVFALMKILLTGTGYLMAVIAVEVVFLALVLAIGVIGGGAGYMLHMAGVPTGPLIAMAVALAIVVYLGSLGYGLLLATGAVSIFIEAHALYFLGGRFPRVGELLDQSDPVLASRFAPALPLHAPLPPTSPPHFPSPPDLA